MKSRVALLITAVSLIASVTLAEAADPKTGRTVDTRRVGEANKSTRDRPAPSDSRVHQGKPVDLTPPKPWIESNPPRTGGWMDGGAGMPKSKPAK